MGNLWGRGCAVQACLRADRPVMREQGFAMTARKPGRGAPAAARDLDADLATSRVIEAPALLNAVAMLTYRVCADNWTHVEGRPAAYSDGASLPLLHPVRAFHLSFQG